VSRQDFHRPRHDRHSRRHRIDKAPQVGFRSKADPPVGNQGARCHKQPSQRVILRIGSALVDYRRVANGERESYGTDQPHDLEAFRPR
jgi:hypothetical protein